MRITDCRLELLAALAEPGRYPQGLATPTWLAEDCPNAKGSAWVRVRLPVLLDCGLIERAGPTGFYRITTEGRSIAPCHA